MPNTKNTQNTQKKFLNLVHFVRGVEPRVEVDLLRPAAEVVALNNNYGYKGTYLLQYDAFILPEFQKLFKEQTKNGDEIGLWLEIVRPMVEACGIKWRGREGYDWDWYVDPGFIMAYTTDERKLLIDATFKRFFEVFGHYPKSVGSWLLDSFSLDYMVNKYSVKGFCICREQVSIDAYTLWGANFNSGWYPSKKNIMCPAQTQNEQINAPVFRIYGNDPTYAYDRARFDNTRFDEPGKDKFLFTIEPTYGNARDMDWVRWFFRTFFEKECLQFSMTQVGQENSFGWIGGFGDSLPEQYKVLDEFVKSGIINIATMEETSDAFKTMFKMTPATVNFSDNDWSGNDIQSVWYNSKHYRANLFYKNGELMFRDIHKFDENYTDRYLETPCHHWEATYDTLPVIDSYNWSKNYRAGLVISGNFSGFEVLGDEDVMTVLANKKDGNKVKIVFSPNEIQAFDVNYMELNLEDGAISPHLPPCAEIKLITKTEKEILLSHNDYEYGISLEKGSFVSEKMIKIASEKGEITIKLDK